MKSKCWRSVAVMGLVAGLAGTAAVTAAGPQAGARGGKTIDSQGSQTLDANELTHLEYMREEEKLARDVYITLGSRYPQMKIFGKIDDAEQRHTCAVCDLLEKYGQQDPNTNDNVGVYTGKDYGAYFTNKFEQLVARGSISKLEALYVGAYIEEMDMIDINYCPGEIVKLDNGIGSASDCGKIYTDNQDIKRLYNSLLEGSKSHLRAFVNNIERTEGKGTYVAQVLPQQEVDKILGR